MTSRDPLLQPYTLKHLTLRNRIMSTSHEPAYSEDGLPKDRYRAYHVEKAKGGIALTAIGGSSLVAPDSPAAFGNLELWKDEAVPWLKKLSDEVHDHGAAVMCQITHLGRRSGWNKGDWLPLVSASAIREPAHRAFPKAAEDWDIERLIRAYADAAARCKDGGIDMVEFEAYGHFMDSFWSPMTNTRDDDYGGSLENRMRFSLEVLEATRKAVGPDYVLGMRMVVDEAVDHGLQEAEGLEIARRLAATGLIDFVNVIKGHIDTDEGLSHVIPGSGTPAAPHLESVRKVKEAIDLPIFHAARINDVATARHAVGEGHLDMVGMTRAHMADPHIAAKIQRGEEERIRPCVGVGYCIDQIYVGLEAFCIHNAATGRELTMPHAIPKADRKKKVVVVGAGPAGLEAARVCGARGHEVVLLEAADQVGGQVRLAAGLERRREVIGITDWLLAEVENLGVDIRYNVFAEGADVMGENPDAVIVATGGLPNTGFLETGEDLVTTTWDILSGQVPPAEKALLFDDNGAHPGISCAEHMAAAGSELEFVSPERTIAPDIGGTNYPAYIKALHKHGVTITLAKWLKGVRRDGNKLVATLYDEYTGETEERQTDQVVVDHGTLPMDDLYFELKPQSSNGGAVDQEALIAGRPQTLVRNPKGEFQLFRVGDAVASRNIHAAVYDSLRLCKDL